MFPVYFTTAREYVSINVVLTLVIGVINNFLIRIEIIYRKLKNKADYRKLSIKLVESLYGCGDLRT